MMTCRVCNRDDVVSLPVAAYAPFFSLRVDTSRDKHALYSSYGAMVSPTGRSLASRARNLAIRKLRRVRAPRSQALLRTSCSFCVSCRSLTLTHGYSNEDLAPLYADYRSPTYNRDRISVEPGYAQIASRVGVDAIEQASRNNGVAMFLAPFLPARPASLALDLGGSDGKFIPPEVMSRYQEIHISDTSDAQVDPSLHSLNVRKITTPELRRYALLMCMHVLEHVGTPRDFVLDALKHLEPGGLLYLEVPLELDVDVEAQFAARNVDRCITIHEHINQYDHRSISQLLRSIECLELLKSESASIDCGWSKGQVGRYLARRVD